jgi:hypothetical protein
MISIKAKEQSNIEKKEYTPLPEGTYSVEVVEIAPEWKAQSKAVEYINARDSKGNLLKDDNGKLIKDTVANYTFHTLDLKLRVISGDSKGRFIFGSLTTHDNVLFLTEGFLYAVGVDELRDMNDIFKHNLVGKTLSVETTNQTYTKMVDDKDTGISNPVEKTRTRIKKYLKSPIVKNNA